MVDCFLNNVVLDWKAFEELEKELSGKYKFAKMNIDEEKAKKWLSTGAAPTETVRSLFKKTGIIE